ncbi:MAG: protein kinase [Polyangiaceae bacterium]
MGGAEDDTLVEGARRPQPDDLPTRAEGARRARPQDEEERSDAVSTAAGVSRLSTLGGTSGRSIATLRDTLRYQEAVSTRSFAFGASALAVVMAALLPWLDGDRTFAAVFAVALLLAALATAYIGVRLADPQRYSLQQVTAGALACGIAAVGGVLYFGVFSPAVVAVPFGLFFFSMAQGFWRTFAVYLISSIAYAALAVPVALEVWADRGLVRPQGLNHRDALLVVAAVEVVFFATFVVARRSRRSSERALAAHDRAVRAVAGRDALLQEARMDLEGVLRARGLGRFTDEVVGDYLLGNILGRGGMGEVYDAVHVDSEEPAAVKLLHPHVLGDTQAVDRFFRECALLESLDVDEVVRVRATSEAGAPIPFIAMERLHGEDLADHLRARGELEPREVVKLLEQVGRGVDAASAAGIVHRDLKPRNLFRAESGARASLPPGRSSTSG